MAQQFFEKWIAHGSLAVFLSLILAGLGIWAATELKIEAYPDMSDLQVLVIALYPGHATEEVEQQVSVPLERALNSVPQVISRRSRSIFGLSVVELTFENDVPQNEARQMVLEKLRDVELPEGVEAVLAPPTTPAGELYRYVLKHPRMNEIQLRELQDWVVAPRLQQVPGVGDVFPFGGLVKQYHISIDPMALYRYGLSIHQVAEAVQANNQNAGGALITSGQQALVVRGLGIARSLNDLENVVVASHNGTPVFLEQIGRVTVSSAPQTGIFGLDAKTGGVEGVVVMRRDENASEVLKAIRAAVEELNSSPLLEGARIDPIYDRTELVSRTVRTVSHTLLEALAVVLLVLVFLLGSLRAALLTVIVIPLSLLFSFLCMRLAGIHASLLSFGAIDFGIIVDGTVVMVECLDRTVRAQKAQDVRESMKAAVGEVWRPILFTMIILISAYLPLFLLERVERRLFMPMAFTIAAALTGSLIFTLTLVPVLAIRVLSRGAAWSNPILKWLLHFYMRALEFLLPRRLATLSAVALVVAAGFVLAGRLGSEFLPQLDEGVIWIRANLPPGVSLEASAETAARIRSAIREFPQVQFVTSQTGRQESNTEPFGPNRNEFLVSLTPYSTWPAGMRKADLIKDLSAKLSARFPGVNFIFTQPIIDMVMESVTGSSADLAVILSGPDLQVLRQKAEQILQLLRRIPGAADAAIEQDKDQPQVHITINRQEAARYGINVADVQEVVELAIGGKAVSRMFENDRVFDIVIRYIPEARSTLNDIGNILVPAPNGARIPLSRVAEIRIADGASIILRRENQRAVSVRTNIRGRDQGSFVAEAQRLFREQVQLPPGYQVAWGGQFENLERAKRRLLWILPLTIGLIFTILYWTFNSAGRAALVLLSVPLSMVGGVVALYVRGIPFSVSAAVGFVSLFGVAVMSGVLLVSAVDRRLRSRACSAHQAAMEAAQEQFRPLATLITVALLGILPAAFATGIGSDIQRPLATVVLGGLISTALLTPLALPALCCLAGGGARRNNRRPA